MTRVLRSGPCPRPCPWSRDAQDRAQHPLEGIQATACSTRCPHASDRAAVWSPSVTACVIHISVSSRQYSFGGTHQVLDQLARRETTVEEVVPALSTDHGDSPAGHDQSRGIHTTQDRMLKGPLNSHSCIQTSLWMLIRGVVGKRLRERYDSRLGTGWKSRRGLGGA